MKIICLEGCSGAGKTTQYHRLNEYFKKDRYNHLAIIEKDYEPFRSVVERWHKEKGPLVSFNRNMIEEFALARAETFQKNFIDTNLDILLLDRYYYTSAVYQSNKYISLEEILSINKRYEIPTPEITFLFNCDPKIAFERSDQRNKITGGKHLFSTSSEKIKDLQEKYNELIKYCPEIEVINTEKNMSKITEEIILRLIKKSII